jgi:hypothetical protein
LTSIHRTAKWYKNPVHHPTDARVIQTAETRDIPDKTAPEVAPEDAMTGMVGVVRAEIRIMVGLIETRIRGLIKAVGMVGQTTGARNMVSERETGKGTGTGKGMGRAPETEIVQARLVVLHHLRGLRIVGQLGLARGRVLARDLLLLWTNRNQTLLLQDFLRRLLIQ